jgi:hypothetical protein
MSELGKLSSYTTLLVDVAQVRIATKGFGRTGMSNMKMPIITSLGSWRIFDITILKSNLAGSMNKVFSSLVFNEMQLVLEINLPFQN